VVRRDFPDVRVIARPDNGGYAVAVNEGARAVPDDDILILNPDVVTSREAIAVLEQYLAAHPKVGIAGPRLVYPDGAK
jgi:GT2 family glycosyltransferase